mgnify:CR=1 FL=1
MSATNAPQEDAMEIEQPQQNENAAKSSPSEVKQQSSTPQHASATNGQEPAANNAADEAKIIEQKIEELNKEIQAVFQGTLLLVFCL